MYQGFIVDSCAGRCNTTYPLSSHPPPLPARRRARVPCHIGRGGGPAAPRCGLGRHPQRQPLAHPPAVCLGAAVQAQPAAVRSQGQASLVCSSHVCSASERPLQGQRSHPCTFQRCARVPMSTHLLPACLRAATAALTRTQQTPSRCFLPTWRPASSGRRSFATSVGPQGFASWRAAGGAAAPPAPPPPPAAAAAAEGGAIPPTAPATHTPAAAAPRFALWRPTRQSGATATPSSAPRCTLSPSWLRRYTRCWKYTGRTFGCQLWRAAMPPGRDGGRRGGQLRGRRVWRRRVWRRRVRQRRVRHVAGGPAAAGGAARVQPGPGAAAVGHRRPQRQRRRRGCPAMRGPVRQAARILRPTGVLGCPCIEAVLPVGGVWRRSSTCLPFLRLNTACRLAPAAHLPVRAPTSPACPSLPPS